MAWHRLHFRSLVFVFRLRYKLYRRWTGDSLSGPWCFSQRGLWAHPNGNLTFHLETCDGQVSVDLWSAVACCRFGSFRLGPARSMFMSDELTSDRIQKSLQGKPATKEKPKRQQATALQITQISKNRARRAKSDRLLCRGEDNKELGYVRISSRDFPVCQDVVDQIGHDKIMVALIANRSVSAKLCQMAMVFRHRAPLDPAARQRIVIMPCQLA